MQTHRPQLTLAAIATAALLVAVQSCDPSTSPSDPPGQSDSSTTEPTIVIAGVAWSDCTYPALLMSGIDVQLILSDTTITQYTNAHAVFRFTLSEPVDCRLILAGQDTLSISQSQMQRGDSLWFQMRTTNPVASIAPGVVIVGVVDSLQFQTLCDLMQSLGLRVYSTIISWEFVSPYLSVDSARSIHSILDLKPYIPDWRLGLTENGDSSTVTVTGFTALDSVRIHDWMQFKALVGMREKFSGSRWVEVRNVPLGHECEWCGIIGATGIARNVILNYLASTQYMSPPHKSLPPLGSAGT